MKERKESKRTRQRLEKIKAMTLLAQGYWKTPSIRLPTNALAAIASAEKFEYIGEVCRRKMEDLPPDLQASVVDFQEEHKDEIESPIISSSRILLDPKGRVKLLPLGKPTKRDKQILFVLFCLASKEIAAETSVIKEVRGAGVSIYPTNHNQVELSWDSLTEMAMVIYGYKTFDNVMRLVDDLEVLAHQEFLLDTPAVGGGRAHYRTILFSTSTCYSNEATDENKQIECVTVTLGDLFFYENHSRYSMFDVENMIRGLSGKNGDIFGNIVFSFSRFLPAATMQMNSGRSFKAVVPIKEIAPGYGTQSKQRNQIRYRIRKEITEVCEDASKELRDGSLLVVGDEIRGEWEKKQDNSE